MLLDTSAMDDYPTVGSSASMGSTEPSLAKSSKKTRSSKAEGFMNVCLPSDGSAYSDTSFIKGIVESLLLPADRKRFANIGPV